MKITGIGTIITIIYISPIEIQATKQHSWAENWAEAEDGVSSQITQLPDMGPGTQRTILMEYGWKQGQKLMDERLEHFKVNMHNR